MSQGIESEKLNVHLGAFDRSVANWLNTDITLHLFIAKIPLLAYLLYKVNLMPHHRYVQHRNRIFYGLKYVDITKRLPFGDNSVNAFFSSHVIEHLFYDETEKLIREMYRCLAINGVCRVVVPDLDKYMGLYDNCDPRRFITELMEIKSRSLRKNAHNSAYTGPLLIKLFTEAGFHETQLLSYRVGRCPDIASLDNRPEESLFFEAIK